MNSLTSLIIHPLVTLNLAQDEGQGIDVLYLISLFFALGIWLVFNRYQNSRNSAIYFEYRVPAVRNILFSKRVMTSLPM
jgi:hypothetical protein